MKIIEINRIIVIVIFGLFLMFLGQPALFKAGMITLADVSVDTWIQYDYMTAARIIFAVCLVSTILWYILTARARIEGSDDVEPWFLIWWVIGFFPIVAIGIALYFFNRSDQALLFLTAFWIIDVLLLYWLTTAIATPRQLRYVPPGAPFLRSIFK
jgi:hypothetical protein